MKIYLLGILSIIAINISSCTQTTQNNLSNNTDKLQVVTTSTIIADLTNQIGGDRINQIPILKPGVDPHVYEPVPQDSIMLEEADLILYNGYNLEPGIIKLIESTGIKAQKLAVGETVKPLDFEYEGQKRPDPHVWGNAQNGITMVKAIRDKLIKLVPEDKEKFTENANKLIKELEETDQWIKAQIKTIPASQRKLVTSHDAFQYYGHGYGLEILGTLIGISTEEQPSAKTVKTLVDKIKATGVKAIFAETTINPTLIETVATEAGVKLADQKLYSDSIGIPGSEADSYIKMLKFNTKVIVSELAK